MGLIFNRKKPEPKVIEVPAPDISQPVQAIINAMRDRPHTFGFFKDSQGFFGDPDWYRVKDRLTGLEIYASHYPFPRSGQQIVTTPFDVTGAEAAALKAAGVRLLEVKRQSVQRYRKIRAERARARMEQKQAAARREWCAKYNVRAE